MIKSPINENQNQKSITRKHQLSA